MIAVPMNRIVVGTAPSPNLWNTQSRFGKKQTKKNTQSRWEMKKETITTRCCYYHLEQGKDKKTLNSNYYYKHLLNMFGLN